MASMKRRVAVWLRQGIAPRRLAFTLALGFAIGCSPILGATSAMCGIIALALKLNLPAIQAANWVAAPFQLILIVPFVRLGGQLTGGTSGHTFQAVALLHSSPLAVMAQMGTLAGQAILAWLLIATPVVALTTIVLTHVLRRIPAVAAAEFVD
jgi:uncharacterized protein (DUF2062 family)